MAKDRYRPGLSWLSHRCETKGGVNLLLLLRMFPAKKERFSEASVVKREVLFNALPLGLDADMDNAVLRRCEPRLEHGLANTQLAF